FVYCRRKSRGCQSKCTCIESWMWRQKNMDFLARLFAPGRTRSKAKTGYVKRDGRYAIWIYVQCDRCGEKIPVRLRTTSELQKREGPDAELGPGQYFVRKTVV